MKNTGKEVSSRFVEENCQTQGKCHLSCPLQDDIIPINESLLDNRGGNLLKNDLEGLNDVYKDIADKIGIENTLEIYRMFRGNQISFPGRLFSKEYIYKAINSEYNGENIKQLAQKYKYSERSIRRILKSEK